MDRASVVVDMVGHVGGATLKMWLLGSQETPCFWDAGKAGLMVPSVAEKLRQEM